MIFRRPLPAVTGAETARVDYHSKGWVLHHNTDLWRATTPVDGLWGIWPTGGFDHPDLAELLHSVSRDIFRRR